MTQYIFELIPLLLAIIAIAVCAMRLRNDRRRTTRTKMILSIVSAVLLIVAQSSWVNSYLINGNLLGTVFADYVWTFFNSLVMSSFIYSAVNRD